MNFSISKYEINAQAFNKLKNSKKLLNDFGLKVAENSFFKPYEYGYYGCELFYDKIENKYYILWKHDEERGTNGI